MNRHFGALLTYSPVLALHWRSGVCCCPSTDRRGVPCDVLWERHRAPLSLQCRCACSSNSSFMWRSRWPRGRTWTFAGGVWRFCQLPGAAPPDEATAGPRLSGIRHVACQRGGGLCRQPAHRRVGGLAVAVSGHRYPAPRRRTRRRRVPVAGGEGAGGLAWRPRPFPVP